MDVKPATAPFQGRGGAGKSGQRSGLWMSWRRSRPSLKPAVGDCTAFAFAIQRTSKAVRRRWCRVRWISCSVSAMGSTTFQLTKTYGDAAASYTRVITKPLAASVRIAKGGIELPITAFAVDAATGKVTLNVAPLANVEIRAGFVFDTPARFDTDRLDVALDAFDAGRVVSLSLVEIAP